MKNLIFSLIFAISLGLGNSLFAQAPKYLELTQEQLKEIGFVFNTDGTFIRTFAPDSTRTDTAFYELSYMNGPDDCGTILATWKKNIMTKIMSDTTEFKKICKSKTCEVFYKIPCSNLQFPLVSISEKDSIPELMVEISKDTRTIPILLIQSNGIFKDKRNLVFYIVYSPELAKKLTYIPNLNSYAYVFKYIKPNIPDGFIGGKELKKGNKKYYRLK